MGEVCAAAFFLYRELRCYFITLILPVLCNTVNGIYNTPAITSVDTVESRIPWPAPAWLRGQSLAVLCILCFGQSACSVLPFLLHRASSWQSTSFTGDVVSAAMISHSKLSSLFPFMSQCVIFKPKIERLFHSGLVHGHSRVFLWDCCCSLPGLWLLQEMRNITDDLLLCTEVKMIFYFNRWLICSPI